MFQAQSQNQYISSKSQSIKPDVVSDVGPNDQIRILLPSYIGFLDPEATYLKMDVQMQNARGIVVPDPSAGGVHSLFRNVILRDGANQCTIESLEDYNASVALSQSYTAQSSIQHKRELFEGVQPAEHKDVGSLYYQPPQTLVGASTKANAQTNARVANKIEVYCKLKTGFMSQNIIPVAAMSGMRIQIDTEDSLRALKVLSPMGSETHPIKIHADLALAAIGQRSGTINGNIGGITLNEATDDECKNNPFSINDILYMDAQTNGVGPYNPPIVIGLVSGFFNDNNKLGIRLSLQSNLTTEVPASADYTLANNARVYYKMADREKNITVISASNITNIADLTISPVSYNISNIEMICQSVQPPEKYIEGMLKKAASAAGLQLDYITSELYRYNQVNTSGLVQIQIPTLAKRSKSVFCQPIPVSSYRSLAVSSFQGIADNARSYQFVKGNELQPSRVVQLQRYSQAVGTTTQKRNEPIHTSELQKALVNIGLSVYSLQKIAENFSIARSFNKYGQVTDLSNESLSLRIDYDSGVAKLFNTYIYKLARLTIANGQCSVGEGV